MGAHRHDVLIALVQLTDPMQADNAGRFGLAVHVDPCDVGPQLIPPRPDHAGPKGFTRGEQQPQSISHGRDLLRGCRGRGFRYPAHHGGNEVHDGHPGVRDSAQQVGWVATLFGRGDHGFGPDCERHQQLPIDEENEIEAVSR